MRFEQERSLGNALAATALFFIGACGGDDGSSKMTCAGGDSASTSWATITVNGPKGEQRFAARIKKSTKYELSFSYECIGAHYAVGAWMETIDKIAVGTYGKAASSPADPMRRSVESANGQYQYYDSKLQPFLWDSAYQTQHSKNNRGSSKAPETPDFEAEITEIIDPLPPDFPGDKDDKNRVAYHGQIQITLLAVDEDNVEDRSRKPVSVRVDF